MSYHLQPDVSINCLIHHLMVSYRQTMMHEQANFGEACLHCEKFRFCGTSWRNMFNSVDTDVIISFSSYDHENGIWKDLYKTQEGKIKNKLPRFRGNYRR